MVLKTNLVPFFNRYVFVEYIVVYMRIKEMMVMWMVGIGGEDSSDWWWKNNDMVHS